MSSEYEYVDERSIDDNLKCPICTEPLTEPVSTPCDHTFCCSCIEQWLQNNSSCPACRQKPVTLQQLSEITVRILLNMLDRLPIRCKACGQTGLQRGNYNDHLCPKSIVLCSASDIGCSWQGRREELTEKHNRNMCPYEQFRDVLEELNNEKDYYSKRCDEFKKGMEEMQMNTIRLTNRCNEQKAAIDKLREEVGKQQCQLLLSSTGWPISEHDIIESIKIRRTVTFYALANNNHAHMGVISDGFAGLGWSNAMYMTKEWATRYFVPISPVIQMFFDNNNNMTTTCIAYNAAFTQPLYVRTLSANDTFSLTSLELVSVYKANVAIIARRHKQQVFDTIIEFNYRKMVVSMSTWNDIDEIEFRSAGIVVPCGSVFDVGPLFALTKIQIIYKKQQN